MDVWLNEMSYLEPLFLQFLDARRDALLQLVELVSGEAEQALEALKKSYFGLVNMIVEVDSIASQWVESNFQDAPAFLMVSVAILMGMTAIAVMWGNETIEKQTEENLKVIEEEKTMDEDMLELIKSKLTLTKQLDDIAIIQDEARKEIIKDALALAILSDRLSVVSEIRKDFPSAEDIPEVHKEETGKHVQQAEEQQVEQIQ